MTITQVRKYQRNGRTQFYFGTSAGKDVHVTERQLEAAGITSETAFNLIGGTIRCEWFKAGDLLVNGDTVRDDNVILKSFSIQKPAALLVAEATAFLLAKQFGVTGVSSSAPAPEVTTPDAENMPI